MKEMSKILLAMVTLCHHDIGELNFGRKQVRIFNSLYAGGIKTVDQLVGATDEQLLKIRNISPYCLPFIKNALSEFIAKLEEEVSDDCSTNQERA